MATAFFGSNFFGGEFFSSTGSVVTPDVTTPTPAGRSSGPKRKWLIGNRTFYGTADEAQEYAEQNELPEPERVSKQKPQIIPKPKPPVEDEIRTIEYPEIHALAGLNFGLLNDLANAQAFAKAIGEQVALMRKLQLDEDDDDILLLL